MKIKIIGAVLAGIALALAPLASASADEVPVHTGYYYYTANDYEHQTLYAQHDGNTLEDPVPIAGLPCGLWSVQVDVVPATQVFPVTLNPNATPLHPIASAHYFNVNGGDCTPAQPKDRSSTTHHDVLDCASKVVKSVYTTKTQTTKLVDGKWVWQPVVVKHHTVTHAVTSGKCSVPKPQPKCGEPGALACTGGTIAGWEWPTFGSATGLGLALLWVNRRRQTGSWL